MGAVISRMGLDYKLETRELATFEVSQRLTFFGEARPLLLPLAQPALEQVARVSS